MGWDGIMRSWHEREEGDGGELKRMEGARVGKEGEGVGEGGICSEAAAAVDRKQANRG